MLIKEICITAILNQIQSETVSPKKPVVLSLQRMLRNFQEPFKCTSDKTDTIYKKNALKLQMI